jgi:hypothetical protein
MSEMIRLCDGLPPLRVRLLEILAAAEEGDLSRGYELVTVGSQLTAHSERAEQLLSCAPRRYAEVAQSALPVVSRCARELAEATGSLIASMARS